MEDDFKRSLQHRSSSVRLRLGLLRSLPAYSDARLRQLVDECLHELEMAAMESDDLEAACTRAENVIAAFPILAARTE